MLRSVFLSGEGKLQIGLSQMDIAFALQDPQGLLWVDFEAEPDADSEPLLLKTFSFHSLAVDDALKESHVPKLDDWGSYLYIVLHAVDYREDEGVSTQELDVFMGKNYMVTHHDRSIEAVERVWNAIQRDDRHMKSGADHLLYRLVDELVASYLPVENQLDLEIDLIENAIFGEWDASMLERLFLTKRSIINLRRILAPQREVLNKLARDELAVIDERDRIYFRDVYDHLVRLYEVTESMRDLVSGTMDTYLSMTNNRMNEVMKTLTVITTMFMPISFVASFFGMNFFQPSTPLDIWTGRPALWITLIILLLTPLGMYSWMRRRRWM